MHAVTDWYHNCLCSLTDAILYLSYWAGQCKGNIFSHSVSEMNQDSKTNYYTHEDLHAFWGTYEAPKPLDLSDVLPETFQIFS